MSDVRHDDIERDSKLSTLYPLAGSDGPPPALDAAIRAAAHRAIGARPRLAGSPFSRSWRVPLSIAALIVVSASLVILMREEAPEVTQLTPPPVAGPISRPDGTANELPKPASPAVAPDSSAGIKPPQQVVPPANTPAAPEPLTKRRAVPEAFPGAMDTREAERAKPERPALKSQARSDVVAASKEASLESMQAEPARPAEAKIKSYEVKGSPAVAGNMQGAASAAKKETAAAAAGKDEEFRDVQRTPAPGPAAAPTATMERQAAQSTDNLLSLSSLPPAKWLERIEELRKQGKLDEARTSLAEFRKRYPDYPLPDTLKDGIRP